MKQYIETLQEILNEGYLKSDRTGTGTLSQFAKVMRFDLTGNKLPLLTTKKMYHRSFIHEMLWFISGSTDIKYLKDQGISIWDSWVKPGTERYRPLDIDEVAQYIRTHDMKCNSDGSHRYTRVDVRDKVEGQIVEGGTTQVCEVFENDEWVRIYICPTEADVYRLYTEKRIEELKERITQNQLDSGWTAVEFIHSPTVPYSTWWAMEAATGSHIREIRYAGREALQDLYMYLTGSKFILEPNVLIGGSIGHGAYGSMWRNIQDTRIIRHDQLAEHVEKGFVIVHDHDKGYVVNRRIDQLANVIKLLKTDPSSRRMVVNAFDPRMVDFCELAPCHSTWAVWTRELTLEERVYALSKEKMEEFTTHFGVDGSKPETLDTVSVKEWLDKEGAPKYALRILLFMRSNDFAVGNPFNIAQYALLGHMLAHVTNMVCEELVWVGNDTHVYIDQINQAHEQTTREIYENIATVELNPNVKDIDDFTFDDITVKGYDKYHPAIRYPVAI